MVRAVAGGEELQKGGGYRVKRRGSLWRCGGLETFPETTTRGVVQQKLLGLLLKPAVDGNTVVHACQTGWLFTVK